MNAAEPVAHPVRLGVIVPSVNTVVEPWFSRVLPSSVSVHASRMLLADDVTPAALKQMDHEEGLPAARRLASCRPHAIAYCCTASSIVQGPVYDETLGRQLQEATGIPTFTAVGAIVESLRALGARRISMASPYTDAIDHAELEYLSSVGFEVNGSANLGISDGFALAAPTGADIYELARRAWRDGSDALLISCLNMNSQLVVQQLEKELGMPVVTSTTAALWKLLRTAGVSMQIQGYGRLLAGTH
jgi:maleate isomerase